MTLDEETLDKFLDLHRLTPKVQVKPVQGEQRMLCIRVAGTQHYWWHDECREVVKQLIRALP